MTESTSETLRTAKGHGGVDAMPICELTEVLSDVCGYILKPRHGNFPEAIKKVAKKWKKAAEKGDFRPGDGTRVILKHDLEKATSERNIIHENSNQWQVAVDTEQISCSDFRMV